MPTLSAPCKEFEGLILDGRMTHGGHAVLRRQASQVVIEQDKNDNIRPIKRDKKKRYHIDGIVACIMATARAMAMPQTQSVYDTRGVISFGGRRT